MISHQEKSKTDGNWYSQSDAIVEGEQQEALPILISDVTQLGYTLVNDSNVEHEIDIEEMDAKSFLKLPSSDLASAASALMAVESMDGDESSRQAYDNETVSDCNQNQSNSIRSIVNDEQALGLQNMSSMSHLNDDQHMEIKYVPSCTPCSSPPLPIESTNFEHLNNQRKDDEVPPYSEKVNLSDFEELPKNFNESIDATLDCKERKFQCRWLRSSSKRFLSHQKSLSSEILSKIYTYYSGHRMKPYKCDVCSGWFKTKASIRSHRYRHIQG